MQAFQQVPQIKPKALGCFYESEVKTFNSRLMPQAIFNYINISIIRDSVVKWRS